MFCSQCGTALNQGARFCHQCGAPVGSPATNPSTQPVASAAPPPVPTPAPAAMQPAAASGPPAPAYTPVTDNATAGANVVNFVGVADVLPVAESLAQAPEQARAAGIDPVVAYGVYAKTWSALDYLTKQHVGDKWYEQAMSWMKRAGQTLGRGAIPTLTAVQGDPSQWLCTLEFTAPEAAIYNLCARQAELRRHLPTRLLRTCLSCRQQRLINPDYEKMVQRRQQMSRLSALLSRNILLAVSRLGRDPKFVCARCQGLEYSERVIVLCPNCGTPQMGALLTRCERCRYDFTVPQSVVPGPFPATAPTTEPRAPLPPVTASAPTNQAEAPRSFKMLSGKCSGCGNPFRIPLDKIPRAGLKGKCSKCGQELRIRPKR